MEHAHPRAFTPQDGPQHGGLARYVQPRFPPVWRVGGPAAGWIGTPEKGMWDS